MGNDSHVNHNNTLTECAIVSGGNLRCHIYNVSMHMVTRGEGEGCENKFWLQLKDLVCSGVRAVLRAGSASRQIFRPLPLTVVVCH